MNRRERRRLRTHERARQDQFEATAKDEAARGALVFATVYADHGEQCCWCDCPGYHNEAAQQRCPGCPRKAFYVLQVHHGRAGVQLNYPVCEGHYPECCDYHEAAVRAAGIPAGPLRVMPIRDDDRDDKGGAR